MSFGRLQGLKKCGLRRLCSVYLIRAFVVGLHVFGYTALLPLVPAYAQSPAPRVDLLTSFPIDQIDPNPANVGDEVVIRLKDPIPFRSGVTVIFDDIQGNVLGASEYAVRVQVPYELKRGTKPWVIVRGSNFSSPPYRDFQISPSVMHVVVNPTTEPTLWRSWSTLIWAGVTSLIVASVAALFYLFMRRINLKEKHAAEQAKALDAFRAKLATALNAKDEPPTHLNETPPVPDALVSACAAGECVLFAGAGLEATCGASATVEMSPRARLAGRLGLASGGIARGRNRAAKGAARGLPSTFPARSLHFRTLGFTYRQTQ